LTCQSPQYNQINQMIENNLKHIKDTIRSTATKCGRNPADIKLIAVSKRFPASAILEASQYGQTIFGENYIQEAALKHEEVGGKIQLHFIGHLQSNKAKIAASIFDMIETVDNYKLAKTLNRHAENLNRDLKILIQVNIGKDPHKSGVLPEETEKLLESISHLPKLQICGLMTIPPLENTPEESRLHFKKLRELSEILAPKGYFHNQSTIELSMGMSSDYTVAIEEGATLIRIGTAIFGQRQ
jgi:PLP dependent protein